MRADHPTLYIEMLRNSGRADEANELFDGEDVTPFNMYWYVQAEFLPNLSKLRKAGKLTKGEKAI